MANWLSLSNLLGVYTSPPLDISLYGDGALTQMTWKSDAPPNCKVHVQTSLSTDQGYSWSDWKPCVNGGSIPDAEIDTPLHDTLLRFRVIMESDRYSVSPAFREISFHFEPVVVFDNKGDLNCKPEIWITKQGKGEFAIINTSQGNADFRFTDLLDQETVYVNSDQDHIETSLAATYRYSSFNDNYLDLPPGKNVFKVRGDANFQLRYQFTRIQ
ncbi:phage tail family protein [Paenibacillus profundus]|uniref:Phage tail family protein n=1 Tax=Paenibacillus profundus TaxID=1173085 RepID=A0ABS8YC89_9BACL|nr:phage tail family protein [Paenibacillus profundus]MCE5169631.1 phage tail family protein [Paenibacillus profundus]